ncbi:MAG: flagellar hook-length control protein FliK [Wigglesworthia glossinidia]|nr:flagellar hook-length control protein FliK [Wigglesworthia glossinidia]
MIYLHENKQHNIPQETIHAIPTLITELEFKKILKNFFNQNNSDQPTDLITNKKTSEIDKNILEDSKFDEINIYKKNNIINNFDTLFNNINDIFYFDTHNKLIKNFNKIKNQNKLENSFPNTLIVYQNYLIFIQDINLDNFNLNIKKLSKENFDLFIDQDFNDQKNQNKIFFLNKNSFKEHPYELNTSNIESIKTSCNILKNQIKSKFNFENFIFHQNDLKKHQNIDQNIHNLSNLENIYKNKFSLIEENLKFIEITNTNNFPDSKSLATVLKEKIICFKQDGVFHLEFAIRPKQLGPINIILKSYESKIKLHISSDNLEIRNILKSSLEELRQSLLENGIFLDSAIISNNLTKDISYQRADNIYNNIEYQKQNSSNEKKNNFMKEKKRNKKEYLNLNSITKYDVYKKEIQYILDNKYQKTIDIYA